MDLSHNHTRLLRTAEEFDPRLPLLAEGGRAPRAPAHPTSALSCRTTAHVFSIWPQLAVRSPTRCATSVVLDGGDCRLGIDSMSRFNDLLFRRERPYFYVFDLLALNRRDLRAFALLQRERQLLDLLPKIESRILYLERGSTYRRRCGRDLGSCSRCGAIATAAAQPSRTGTAPR
jgi:hypothetical protein